MTALDTAKYMLKVMQENPERNRVIAHGIDYTDHVRDMVYKLNNGESIEEEMDWLVFRLAATREV